jgi:hypothetical protein
MLDPVYSLNANPLHQISHSTTYNTIIYSHASLATCTSVCYTVWLSLAGPQAFLLKHSVLPTRISLHFTLAPGTAIPCVWTRSKLKTQHVLLTARGTFSADASWPSDKPDSWNVTCWKISWRRPGARSHGHVRMCDRVWLRSNVSTARVSS